MRLLDILLGLPPGDVDTISSISINDNSGDWVASINYLRWIVRNNKNAPQGTTRADKTRVPSSEHKIRVPSESPVEDIEAQIVLVGESGIIGNVDMARFESERGTLRWTIKSHAGSDKERASFVKRNT